MQSRPLTHPTAHRAPQPPKAGMLLCDRYQLEEPIARGGTATVFRATDTLLGEPVAIKVLLLDGVMSTPAARACQLGFREEAISAMRLSHPMILRLHNYEVHPPWEFLVMEYVAGETLTQFVKRRPQKRLTVIETIQMGIDCLEALQYAHGAGVIHNDIKPANILFTRAGAIKLCDFGLARMVEASAPDQHVVAGTPGFMAPEILHGWRGDQRSDLFSLAATMYALGNGRLMMTRGAEEAYAGPPPSTFLPLAVHEVLCMAAAPDARDRFTCAEEMRRALADVRDQVQQQHALFFVEDAPVPTATPELDVSSSMVADDCPFEPMPNTAPRATIADDANMVTVGERTLRSAHGGVVEIAPFRLDRTPVTNAAYAQFIAATGEPAPAHWLGGKPPAHALDHPVVGVTHTQARRYAEYLGKRLPTASEWEAAARGTGTAFPWGNEWEPWRCAGAESGADGTRAVGLLPEGASPEGCLDLLGNVWEWTDGDARLNAPDEGFAWVFGGSFRHACQVDGAIARSAVAVNKAYEYLGFRCALDGATS